MATEFTVSGTFKKTQYWSLHQNPLLRHCWDSISPSCQKFLIHFLSKLCHTVHDYLLLHKFWTLFLNDPVVLPYTKIIPQWFRFASYNIRELFVWISNSYLGQVFDSHHKNVHNIHDISTANQSSCGIPFKNKTQDFNPSINLQITTQ